MSFELTSVTYQGPPVEAPPLLDQLPRQMAGMLSQINGFIQFGGGLHVRGVCQAPDWHSLALVWSGPLALHRHYPALRPDDVPFGQDVLGDQFLLRDEGVYRLAGETGDLKALGCDLFQFLANVQADPIAYLQLQPLVQFHHEGGQVAPGQLLSAYPPFCTSQAKAGVSLRAVPTLERLSFLVDFARQIRELPDGAQVEIKFAPSDESP